MAVQRFWIKPTVIVMSVVLLLLVMVELALIGVSNAVLPVGVILINASIEFVILALFITPAIWVSISAAVSRHRGVYITMTVLISLSLLGSLAFLVYEGYMFSESLLYTSLFGGFVQGIMISRLVCWSLITVMLMVLLGIAVAGDCSHSRPEFKYYNHGQPAQAYSMPPEYAPRPLKSRPYEGIRDYPQRLSAPKYSEYVSSPRAYYPRY